LTEALPEVLSDLDRLAAWQQGDFSTDCTDFLFCEVTEDPDSPYDFGLDSTVCGFCVISQTCDVVRDPATHFIKSVIVCPIVTMRAQDISQIEKGEQPRFGFIEGAPENTVVDFTRTMSVHKSLLVRWERKRGCPNEQSLRTFAGSLERFFGRFGFPDSFNESMQSFRKAVNGKYGKAGSELGKVIRSLREFRVYPHAPWDSLANVPVTIIAILKDKHGREIKDIATIRKELTEQVEKIVWVPPFQASAPALQVAGLDDLTAAEYLNSYALDLNALSFAKRYK
jgi:hypothetical protein